MTLTETTFIDYNNVLKSSCSVNGNTRPEAISVDYKTDAESLVVNWSQPEASAMDLCNRIGLHSPVVQ
jgi:hypothetical protein